MSDDDLLTTAEAARIAHVGASSVKRWADQNLLSCVRTAGGHRRFRRADLDHFLAQLGEQDGSAAVWADRFTHGTAYEIWGQIIAARGRSGSYYEVAEQIGRGLVELGLRWHRGDITILDEHAASDKLSRALQRTSESLGSDPASPTSVLATAEGDEHTLGLSLAELVLRESGWAVRWAGRKTRSRDLVELVKEGSVELVVLAASSSSSDTSELGAQLRHLGPACSENDVHLVLGGSGAWPERPEHGERVLDFKTLHSRASAWRRELAGA